MITNVIVYTAANGSRYARPIARVLMTESTIEKLIELSDFLQGKGLNRVSLVWFYDTDIADDTDYGTIDIRGRYEGQPGDELEMIVKESVKEWEARQ